MGLILSIAARWSKNLYYTSQKKTKFLSFRFNENTTNGKITQKNLK